MCPRFQSSSVSLVLIYFSLGFRVTDLNHLLLLLLVHHIEDLFNEGLLEEQRRDLSSLV